MRQRMKLLALAATVPLLMAGSCPTPPQEKPQPPAAPQIVESSVVVAKVGQSYEELVYLRWESPDSDTVGIDQYVILQQLPFDTSIDTLGLFPSEPYSYPGDRTFAYQLTENIRKYGTGEILKLYYSIIAVDTIGQRSDTSQQAQVWLLKTASPVTPRDTLLENQFSWDVTGIQDEVFSNMTLWNNEDSLPIYVSDTTADFGGQYITLSFGVILPGTVYPLPTGDYTWAIRLARPRPAPGAVSYKIGTFHAP